MEREQIGKLTREHSQLWLGNSIWADIFSNDHAKQVMAACGIRDSLIPQEELERSEEYFNASNCVAGEFYYLSVGIVLATENWSNSKLPVVFFLYLKEDETLGTCVRWAGETVYKAKRVELPRKAEARGEKEAVLSLICPNCEQNTLPGFAYEDPKLVSICSNCSYRAVLDPDDVPGLNPPEPQKTPMELLEERVMAVEKMLDDFGFNA